jgi:hypothetical protein
VIPLPVRLAASAVRTWARVYTWHAPEAEAERRREQIESDLWESIHDPNPARRDGLAVQIVARLINGIPADVAWRLEQPGPDLRRIQVAITIGAVGMLVLWLALVSASSALPPLPAAPPALPQRRAPPPPPPPPPPCLPPGFGGSPPACVR